jgi:hypothetical protein
MKVAGTWAADPGTPSPRWIEFLNTAMGGDPALVSYLQRVCGYCLTGSIAEHALFFLYGTGATANRFLEIRCEVSSVTTTRRPR